MKQGYKKSHAGEQRNSRLDATKMPYLIIESETKSSSERISRDIKDVEVSSPSAEKNMASTGNSKNPFRILGSIPSKQRHLSSVFPCGIYFCR